MIPAALSLEVYAVKITGRSGHQKDNPHWKIGNFLRHRPEITEDCHGPGGGETYRSVEAENATFGSLNEANKIIRFMNRRFPEIAVMRVKFVEVP